MMVQNDESLLGLLKRTALQQSFRRFEDFQSALGFVYGRAALEDLEGLSDLCGIEPSVLDTMIPRAVSNDPALAWSYQRMHRDPVCPQCLAEGLPRRKEWRHALVTTCALHGTELVDTCGSCGSALTLAWGGHKSCLCGATLSQNSCVPAEPLGVQLARYVGGMTVNLAGLEFDAKADPDAVRAIWFLASGMQEPRSGKAGKAEIPKTVEEAKRFIEPISDVLLAWPAAFDAHVKARWERGDSAGLTAAQRLGPWYRALVRLRGALGKRLIDRCHTVAGQQLGDPYKTHGAGEDGEWMSAAEAGRVLGIRAERVVEAVRANAVEGRFARSGSGHQHTVISWNAVEQLKSLRSRYLNKSSARDLMGVSRKQFDLLEEAGFVCQDAGVSEHPCVDGRYDGDALTEQLFRARAGVKEPAEPDATVIKFKELNLRRTTDRAALLALFRKIATGEIKPVRWPVGAPLADAEFNDIEISDHLKTAGAARLWTANEVARITGWKPEVVTHWCENGLLRADRGRRGSLPTWQINEQDLSDFQTRYSVLADIARDAGTSSRHLLKRLSEAGIPTHGAKAVGSTSRGHLVRTSELLLGLDSG